MRRTSLIVATLCTIAVCFSACKENKFKGYESTESGLYYKFKERNPEGKISQMGDFLFMTVSYHSDNDSIPKFESREIMDVMSESLYKGDLYEAYSMLKEGEEAEFVIKADSFFYYFMRQVPPFITAENVLYFTIRMEKVKSVEDFEQEEEAAIADYITRNNISVEPTESGLYYIETEKGKGKKVEMGDSVRVHYTGKFLDETVFESSVGNEPLAFRLGVNPMIEGFVEGVLLMNQGGKATLILPFDIAYGMSHPMSSIPPFTPLLFEIEMVEVRK